jgi:hypothetical protein
MVKNPEVQKTKAMVIRPKKVKDPHRIIHILTNISPYNKEIYAREHSKDCSSIKIQRP